MNILPITGIFMGPAAGTTMGLYLRRTLVRLVILFGMVQQLYYPPAGFASIGIIDE